MKLFLLSALIFISSLAVPNVHAQNSIEMDVVSFQKALSDLNRLKPLQNPKYERSKNILNRRILDSRNKIIGEVQDVLVGHDGEVFALLVSFDRLRLMHDVYLNYQAFNVLAVSKGYKLGFKSDEIVDLYPGLPRNIDAAAEQGGVVALSSILDRPVVNTQGKKIGKITDILFENSGKTVARERAGVYLVKAAHISINYKTIHNHGLAIPFAAIRFEKRNARITVVIDQAFSDLAIQFAKN